MIHETFTKVFSAMKQEELIYKALRLGYSIYEEVKGLFGDPMDLRGEDPPLYEIGSVAQARELMDRLFTIFYGWRDQWAMSTMSRVVNEYNNKPETTEYDSIDHIWEVIGDDSVLAQRVVIVMFRMWAGDLGRAYPQIIRRVVKEYRSRTANAGLEVDILLQKFDKDLVGSTEISDNWEGSAQSAGKILSACGYDRKRVRGAGENQYIWIIRNHGKYANMKPAELRRAWEATLTGSAVDSDQESVVSFL